MTRSARPAWGRITAAGLTGLLLLAFAGLAHPPSARAGSSTTLLEARKHIKHVIVIVQENRSFDEYFGTYPGAAGYPRDTNGNITTCVYNPVLGRCSKPYHDTHDINKGGPHNIDAACQDIDAKPTSSSGSYCTGPTAKMDGFIKEMFAVRDQGACLTKPTPECKAEAKNPPVMGYHTRSEIPNYWTYASHFVLQDHMFEPTYGWSLPSHLFFVSGWSADCSDPENPMSCTSNARLGRDYLEQNPGHPFAWTDLTYLLDHHNPNPVSWLNYVGSTTPPYWNVLPHFTTVAEIDKKLGNVVTLEDGTLEPFKTRAVAGKLPSVTWIFPSLHDSEHPPNSVCQGQAFVTSIVNTVMQSPDWSTSAIFVTWDDWGGFYDHIRPPIVDSLGYGLRVPGLTISPWVKPHYIDKQRLSFDAYLKFTEDLFLNGQRLDPNSASHEDGRPDSRPKVRETMKVLGDLLNEFDFSQKPLNPMPLEIDPPPCTGARPGV